jgi:hypothetical protein
MFPLKTLHPGGVRTRVFLFLRGMRCPLRRAVRATMVNFYAKVSRITENKLCEAAATFLIKATLPVFLVFDEGGFKHCFSLLCVTTQGCQIFVDKISQKLNYHNITKWPLNIPNDRKLFQMTVKYTSIFYSKALQNLPKLRFLV